MNTPQTLAEQWAQFSDGFASISSRLGSARAIRQLKENWEIRRKTIDAAIRGDLKQELEAGALERELNICVDLFKQAETVLAGWRDLIETTQRSIAERLLKQAAWRRRIKSPDSEHQVSSYLAHWGDQLGSIESEVKLERALERFEDCMLDLSDKELPAICRRLFRFEPVEEQFTITAVVKAGRCAGPGSFRPFALLNGTHQGVCV